MRIYFFYTLRHKSQNGQKPKSREGVLPQLGQDWSEVHELEKQATKTCYLLSSSAVLDFLQFALAPLILWFSESDLPKQPNFTGSSKTTEIQPQKFLA